jgi:hypothetical protein
MDRFRSPDFGEPIALLRVMKFAALVVLAVALGACTPADDERAKAQARETTAQAKHDAVKAGHEIKTEAEKASQKVDQGLHEARDKIRGALDQPSDRK